METNVDTDSNPPVSPPDEKRGSQAYQSQGIETNWMMIIFYSLIAVFEALCLSAVMLTIHWGYTYYGGFAWDGTGKMFNWHPVLMIIGLVVLYGNGKLTIVNI